MLAKYKEKTYIGIGFGFPLIVLGGALWPAGGLSLIFSIGGLILFIWGCCSFAKGKGYHGAWGLLGMFSFIGPIILACFPDKHKMTDDVSAQERESQPERSQLKAGQMHTGRNLDDMNSTSCKDKNEIEAAFMAGKLREKKCSKCGLANLIPKSSAGVDLPYVCPLCAGSKLNLDAFDPISYERIIPRNTQYITPSNPHTEKHQETRKLVNEKMVTRPNVELIETDRSQVYGSKTKGKLVARKCMDCKHYNWVPPLVPELGYVCPICSGLNPRYDVYDPLTYKKIHIVSQQVSSPNEKQEEEKEKQSLEDKIEALKGEVQRLGLLWDDIEAIANTLEKERGIKALRAEVEKSKPLKDKKETERGITASEQELGVKALEAEIERLKLLKEKKRLEAEVNALRKELGEEYDERH